MSITVVVCRKLECGILLNGELCKYVNREPYCYVHAKELEKDEAGSKDEKLEQGGLQQ